MLLLLAANYAVYVANFFVANLDRVLPLVAFRIQWWQVVTYAFYHQSFAHLTSNMFMLWAFGKAVEQEEGAWGVILYYIVCAVGAPSSALHATRSALQFQLPSCQHAVSACHASGAPPRRCKRPLPMNGMLFGAGRDVRLAFFLPRPTARRISQPIELRPPRHAGSAAAFALTSPKGVCIGASGAVFGLYVIALGVLLRKFSLRKLLEVVAITPFVVGQITSNVAAQVGGGTLASMGAKVAYMGHLGGALTGLLLVALNFAVPSED